MSNSVDQLLTPTPGPFLVTIAIYFVVIAAIGYVAASKTKNMKDFLVMGGKAGTIVSGIAYFATQYSMSTFMGVPAIAYNNGFAGMSITVPGVAFSMLIPALLVGRKLMQLSKHNNFLTMTDYLADRYQSSSMRVIHAVAMVIFLVAMTGAQLVGAGVIVKTFTGYPEWIGVVCTGAVVMVYCMYGGMRGAMLTDVLQGSLMVMTAVVTFVMSVRSGGGIEAITAQLAQTSPDHLTHPGAQNQYGLGVYISMILMWSFFTIGQPTLFTKFFSMKNYSVLFKSIILGTLGMLISATMIEWSGVNAYVSIVGLSGKDADFVVPIMLQTTLNPILASVMIAGIVSAGMSTVSALMVVATGGVSRDIYQKLINPQATDKTVFRLSQIVTVAIGIISIIIGIMKPASIFEIVRFSFGGLGIWVIAVILGMYWKKATTAGVLTGVVVGELYFVALKVGWLDAFYSFHLDALIPAWCLGMVVAIIVSYMTKPVNEEVINRHFSSPI
ncbi:sodium:solute symporter family transporter [Neisseria sp. Ec49-e6-T10]|uniref:sodium:solute symporter family transporter n=1 Tax=Neisseria sp. Ec49-e6-T10 TaxID=3140744 RepID=UPI003EBD1AAC